MKKVIVDSRTMKPVKLGDFIEIKQEKEYSFGTIVQYEKFALTEKNINDLITAGILKITEEKDTKKDIPTDIDFYIKKLAKTLGLSFPDTCKMLGNLNTQSPHIVLSMLLSQIAAVCNAKADVAAKDLDQVYCISAPTGLITRTEIGPGMEYLNYFLKKEDAQLAKTILAKQLEFMYGK